MLSEDALAASSWVRIVDFLRRWVARFCGTLHLLRARRACRLSLISCWPSRRISTTYSINPMQEKYLKGWKSKTNVELVIIGSGVIGNDFFKLSFTLRRTSNFARLRSSTEVHVRAIRRPTQSSMERTRPRRSWLFSSLAWRSSVSRSNI